MNNIFILLNLFLLLIPFSFLLDKNSYKFQNIKSVIPATLITSIIFSSLTIFFTLVNVWSFSPEHLIGIFFNKVPLEQYLFTFTFTFACLAIFNYLNIKFPKNDLQKYSLAISNLMIGVCIAFLFFCYTKAYTTTVFGLLIMLFIYIEYFNRLRFMYRFYRLYISCLIPFYISYGILCNFQVITYNKLETVQLSLGNVPLENNFFIMVILLFGVYMVELTKDKKV